MHERIVRTVRRGPPDRGNGRSSRAADLLPPGPPSRSTRHAAANVVARSPTITARVGPVRGRTDTFHRLRHSLIARAGGDAKRCHAKLRSCLDAVQHGSGLQSRDGPGTRLEPAGRAGGQCPRARDSIMDARLAFLPEFDLLRPEPVATPMRRARNFIVSAARRRGIVAFRVLAYLVGVVRVRDRRHTEANAAPPGSTSRTMTSTSAPARSAFAVRPIQR